MTVETTHATPEPDAVGTEPSSGPVAQRTIVLPSIVGDLGGAGHLSWVVSSYLLADTIATVLAGKFGDQFGRKRLFQVAAAGFVVASAFCGLAQGMP